MFWLSSFVVLCTGLAATQASSNYAVQVIRKPPPTLDMVKNCSPSTVDVQFKKVQVGDTEYTRTVLSFGAFVCIEAGAQLLNSTKFLDCAKEAFAKAYNTFYINDNEECYGTNQPLAPDAHLCTDGGIVVYVAVTAVGPFTKTVPALYEFSLSHYKMMESFVVNFAPSCYGFEYELRKGDQILKIVENHELVTFPLCPNSTLSLHTLVDGTANGTAIDCSLTKKGYVEVDAVCYFFSSPKNNFKSSKTLCPDGFVMASPSDDTHRNLLLRQLQKSANPTYEYWLDITYQNGSWIFGNGVTTNRVSDGSGGFDACAIMTTQVSSGLRSRNCWLSFRFICQFN